MDTAVVDLDLPSSSSSSWMLPNARLRVALWSSLDILVEVGPVEWETRDSSETDLRLTSPLSLSVGEGKDKGKCIPSCWACCLI